MPRFAARPPRNALGAIWSTTWTRLGGTRSLREDLFVLQECDPTVTSYLPWYALKYHVNSKDIESIVEAKVRYSDAIPKST